MSWLGNLLNFEQFNLKEMGRKIGKNPERLLVGAADPVSSSLWGRVLGKNYEPIVDQFGGASSDTYGKAEAAGIDTGAGKGMHSLAKAIASFYAGGYGAGKLGGAPQMSPMDAYMKTGASEGSTYGGFGGGSSNAVGSTSQAGILQSAMNGMKTAGQYAPQALQGLQAYQSMNRPAQPQPMQPVQGQDVIGQMLQQQAQLEEQRRKQRYGTA